MTALVVGGGVAGITAAKWLDRYEAPFHWVSADGKLGGILDTVHNPIRDFPGVDGASGPELAETLGSWAPGHPEHLRIARVRAVDDGFDVEIDGGPTQRYSHVLLATGTRRRALGVPGEAEGLGRWVRSSSTSPGDVSGSRIVVVGGGDAGVEGALNLFAAGAREITLVTRTRLSAQRHFVRKLMAHDGVGLREGASVVRISWHEGELDVTLEGGENLEVDLVFVRIGVEPIRPRLEPRPRLDEQGFIVVDGRNETDIPGLFAAGDVTSTPLRSIATSVGDASRAARAIAEALGIWTGEP